MILCDKVQATCTINIQVSGERGRCVKGRKEVYLCRDEKKHQHLANQIKGKYCILILRQDIVLFQTNLGYSKFLEKHDGQEMFIMALRRMCKLKRFSKENLI